MITETSGVTTLVASSRPPSPTSATTAVAPWRAKYRNASAVVISKVVSFVPWSREGRISSTSVDQIGMRDRLAVQLDALGVILQVRRGVQAHLVPGGLQGAGAQAQTEPLPLVPATWMTG